jgi:V8-like Glu-specific endopeptidase
MTYFDEDRTKPPAEYIGSGTLIGKQCVLTAAHNLYDNTAGLPDRITFFAGLDGIDDYFAFSKVSQAGTTYEYISSSEESIKREADMGVIILDTPIIVQQPLPLVQILDDSELTKKEVTVAGYPGIDYMFHMTGPIEEPYPNQLFYDIDTEPGQSGSGICYEKDNQHFIVGIHAYGTKREKEGNHNRATKEYKYNSGTRITKEKKDLIDYWLHYLS